MGPVELHDQRPRVLLVEDEDTLVEVMEAALERDGYNFAMARTGDEALERACEFQPDAVLLDVNLPGQSGFLVAAKLKLLEPSPRIIFLTALPRGQSDRMAAFLKAEAILHKPVSVKKVLSELNRALGARQLAA